MQNIHRVGIFLIAYTPRDCGLPSSMIHICEVLIGHPRLHFPFQDYEFQPITDDIVTFTNYERHLLCMNEHIHFHIYYRQCITP